MGARAPGVFFIELLLRSEPFFLLPSLEAFAFLGGVEESTVSAFSINIHFVEFVPIFYENHKSHHFLLWPPIGHLLVVSSPSWSSSTLTEHRFIIFSGCVAASHPEMMYQFQEAVGVSMWISWDWWLIWDLLQ